MRWLSRTHRSPRESQEQGNPRKNYSLGQLTWMTLGLVVLAITAVVAAPNLAEIYNAQKDFVVGSLFALVGFFFGKAFSKTLEQKAIELIRDQSTPQVTATLSGEIRKMLHDRGAFEELSVLERNISAASGRLLEYFDSQSAKLDFYRDSPPLNVALDDLDHATANVIRLRNRMEGRLAILKSTADEVGPAFASIHRDLHESNRRRIELYEHLKLRPDQRIDDDAWAILGVMTSDILKAERTLAVLRSGYPASDSAEESISQIIGYLSAALGRAEEFREATATGGVPMPELFHVMTGDIHKALNRIRNLTSQIDASIGARVVAATAAEHDLHREMPSGEHLPPPSAREATNT